MKVLLYYKYTPIKNPKAFMEEQRDFCEARNIKGRILISTEGINGTVVGTPEHIDEYMKFTEENSEIRSMEWKVSEAEAEIFPKLQVVVRDEIVTLGLKSKDEDVSLENKADYIEPEELLALYEKGEEFYIIDTRNEYEARIGKFKDAIYFDIDSFKELPEVIEEVKNLKDKPVITYCTGGVRCEKASALFKEKGFKNVRQLHGGIQRYGDVVGGKNFEGTMYVFDRRVHVPVNSVNPTVISECYHCSTKVARYLNCCNAKCNKQIICCVACEDKMDGGCSVECSTKRTANSKRRLLYQESQAA